MKKKKYELDDFTRDALYDGCIEALNGLSEQIKKGHHDELFNELIKEVWKTSEKIIGRHVKKSVIDGTFHSKEE